MTRREFVIKNYGGDIVDDDVFGGIQGCPAHYKKLVEVDKSITSAASYGACSSKPGPLSNEVCTKCWNEEIPGTKKTRPHGFRLEKKEEISPEEALKKAVCECDSCKNRDLCKFEDQFRGMTRQVYKICLGEIPRYNLQNLGIRLSPIHCKRYEMSVNIDELNKCIFQMKARDLTQEMIRKIFDVGSKENK